jgi:hypothetical protein
LEIPLKSKLWSSKEALLETAKTSEGQGRWVNTKRMKTPGTIQSQEETK